MGILEGLGSLVALIQSVLPQLLALISIIQAIFGLGS